VDVILILLMIGLIIAGGDLLLEYLFGTKKEKRPKKKLHNSLKAFAGAGLCLILVMSGGEETEKPSQAKKQKIKTEIKKIDQKAKRKTDQEAKRKKDQRLAQEKKKRADEEAFEKGIEYFTEGNYSRASKYLSKISASSVLADTIQFYLYISDNEKSLKKGNKIWIKGNRANVRKLPLIGAEIEMVLPEETEIQHCYEYEDWIRVYRRGENNWIFADVAEVNGWVHSSLIEESEAHKKTIARKSKEQDIRRKEEEKLRKELQRENLDKFLPWQIRFFSQYRNLVNDIEPMSMDSPIIMVKVFLNSYNQIVIENIGIEAAIGLKQVFGSDHHIAVYLAVGHSEIAEVRWSSFQQRYICEFND